MKQLTCTFDCVLNMG